MGKKTKEGALGKVIVAEVSENKVLVDTDILIDISRNDLRAIKKVEDIKNRATVSISVITKLELIRGCRNKIELTGLEDFIERFEIRHINEAVSAKTEELFKLYRLSHGVQIPDMLIAATALVHQIPLLSKNQKDFNFIDGLHLIPYPG